MSSSDDEASSPAEEVDVDPQDGGPTALAQVMANILASSSEAKKKEKILSKASESKRLKRSENEKNLLRLKREAKRKRQQEKLTWERMAMVKPSIEDKDRERTLAKVATKGVVQLFNAVSAQQDRLQTRLAEEGTTDAKRTRIVGSLSRSSFIDLLKSQSGVKAEVGDEKKKSKREPKAEKAQPKWKSLHDDFGMSEFASGLGPQSDSEQVKDEPY